MQQEEFLQLKAYARNFGGIMGLWWILSFACFVGVLYEPALSFAFDLSIIAIPFIAVYMVSYYRDRILKGVISLRRGFAYAAFILFYATLILAIAQWVYFAFLDSGRIVTVMLERINSPEMQPVFEAYAIPKAELIEQMNAISASRPIDLVFSFMWFNMFASLVISFLVALICKRTKRIAYGR